MHVSALVFRDHPRVCGEQFCINWVRRCIKGSSPRVRGAVFLLEIDADETGIIPACAGSRESVRMVFNVAGDHPRVCGEQVFTATTEHTVEGSSPRVRGAVYRHRVGIWAFGIIPACAGSSAATCTGLPLGRDHPRVCGEQARPNQPPHNGTGSSPRVRGAAPYLSRLLNGKGIIPACAGSSLLCNFWTLGNGDHPRVCGEQWRASGARLSTAGSSPRVRGAVTYSVELEVSNGIIPACAGSRSKPFSTLPRARDHPRVCGEQRTS